MCQLLQPCLLVARVNNNRRFEGFRELLSAFQQIDAVGPPSARNSRSRAFAVCRLVTTANLVACSTGMSAGLAPMRILSTKTAARRYTSRKFTPYHKGPARREIRASESTSSGIGMDDHLAV